jgi:hypothetical protein
VTWTFLDVEYRQRVAEQIMQMDQDNAGTGVVMPVGDLHGRAVWTEDGHRLGTVRDVVTDDDGQVVSLDIRERWILGPHHLVPASGLRLDDGDVVLPAGTRLVDPDGDVGVVPARASRPMASVAPVLLAGREGARSRFGGLDLVASFFGALVTFASVVLIGGVLAAIFGTGEVRFDTSLDSFSSITSQTLLVGGATLLLASLLGGWCAGRGARFDGVGNGMMTVVWVLAIGVGLGALGAWLGDQYDVYSSTNLPRFVSDDFALWGSVAFAVALVLMLVGGAIGGAIGEHWHRRADRAMLDVVPVEAGATTVPGQVGSSGAAQPVVMDDESRVTDRRPRM